MSNRIDTLSGRNWHEKLPPVCPHCGYILFGVSAGRCPECGKRFFYAQIQQQAKRIYHELQCIEDMNDYVRIGHYVTGGGYLCLVGLELLGMALVGRPLALLLGFTAFGSGAQLFRIRNLPRWAAPFMPHAPNYTGGWINILLGGVLVVAAHLLPSF